MVEVGGCEEVVVVSIVVEVGGCVEVVVGA